MPAKDMRCKNCRAALRTNHVTEIIVCQVCGLKAVNENAKKAKSDSTQAAADILDVVSGIFEIFND